MPSNDNVILDQILEARRCEVAPSMAAPDYFTMFVAEQLLKDAELSYDELETGIVDGANDGGIDAVYVFLNGHLIQEPDDLPAQAKNRNPTVEVVIIQAKSKASFEEAPLDRFLQVSSDVLDLSRDLDDLAAVYSERVLAAFQVFREVHRKVVAKFPALVFRFCYASKGAQPHPKVQRKVERLDRDIQRLFSSARTHVEFVGARELLDLARRAPRRTYSLRVAETPIASEDELGFVCLVKLSDYYEFITDGGTLQHQLFEANVRDYQGATSVNQEIRASLTGDQEIEFWWLNNGVTVVASNARFNRRELTIEDPRVVNGLQTSREIYEYLSTERRDDGSRRLLVRVVVPSSPEAQDRIIRATNSQTAIPTATLRATDRVQRNIEDYFRKHDLHYDRRKNFYKNEGKPKDRIISIAYLAQCVMAVLLQSPDTARARPSSLLSKDSDYAQLFNDRHPMDMYRVCFELVRAAENYLAERGASRELRTNLRFHLAAFCGIIACGAATPAAEAIARVPTMAIDDTLLGQAYEAIYPIFDALGASGKAAKGPDFRRQAIEAACCRLG